MIYVNDPVNKPQQSVLSQSLLLSLVPQPLLRDFMWTLGLQGVDMRHDLRPRGK